MLPRTASLRTFARCPHHAGGNLDHLGLAAAPRHDALAYFVPLACQVPPVIVITLLRGARGIHLVTG